VKIATKLNRWPDVVITNERSKDVRTLHPEMLEIMHLPNVVDNPPLFVTVSNRPTDEELSKIFLQYDFPLITLHGWLRIISPWFCNKYEIYNGHPGLITTYPELKGKDPQMRAWLGNYSNIGCVLHRVTEGVDEGPIKYISSVADEGYDMEGVFRILSKMSLSQWVTFLEEELEL
jgi:folate-dependent phosphoribosylglycinamide formyltransferase PurN